MITGLTCLCWLPCAEGTQPPPPTTPEQRPGTVGSRNSSAASSAGTEVPGVEIQINVLDGDVLDDEKDDYISKTNAPGLPKTRCRARLMQAFTTDVEVELKDEAGGGEVRFPDEADVTKTLTLSQFGTWKEFYISGKKVSDAKDDAKIIAYKKGSTTSKLGGQDLTVCEVNLKIDADNNGAIEYADEDKELTTPGKLIYVNHDDDNRNNIADRDENRAAVTDENDLQEIRLSYWWPIITGGKIILSSPTGGRRIRVWKSATKGVASDEVSLPKEWTIGTDSIPLRLYVEGDEYGVEQLKLAYEINGAEVCKDEVLLSIVKMEFKELGDNYGWDNYTDSKVPWKSVEDGNKTDTVKAEITPASAASQVYFKSTVPGKVTVSPAQASSSPETVTVTGVAKGESEIQANIGSVDGTTCAMIKTACYTKKLKTIAVTLVHEKATPGPGGDAGYTSTDISDTDITDMLKKVYKQSVQEFTLTRLPEKTVDFDDNHDGKLDNNDSPGWMNPECTKIRDACQSAHDYNIFIVSNGSDPNTTGWMKHGQTFGFVFPDTGGNARTFCHELGHGQGLSHSENADSQNIMYYSSSTTKWRLRKGQWDSLQP